MPYPEEILELAAKVRNWGRWGDDDEVGTVNLITDEVVKAAMSSVRTGERISLAFPLQDEGGLQIGAIPGRVNPAREMIMINEQMFGEADMFCTSDDKVTMGLQAGTHWDGLCHASWRGKIYGGRDADSITEAGASTCGIDKIASLTGRGVLMDIAALHGVDELEGGHAVSYEDLVAAEERQGVTVRAGDIVLVRTGMMRKALAGDVMGYAIGTPIEGAPLPGFPGVGLGAVRFFHERDVAAVATDTMPFEVLPWDPAAAGAILPIHCLHLVEMGLTQGQNWNLEELSAACAADGHYDFLLEASPQPFVGGVGSPVNPVAIR